MDSNDFDDSMSDLLNWELGCRKDDLQQNEAQDKSVGPKILGKR